MTDSAQLQLYNPHATDTCSEPLYRFISEYDQLIGFFFFVINMSSRIDKMREIATRTLAKVEDKKVDEEKIKEETALKGLQRYASINSSLLTITMVDNFLCYFSEVIQVVMSKKREVLISSERIALEEIFQFSIFSDLVSYIVDKKVNELSYGGLRQMESFAIDRLGIKIFENDNQKTLLTIFIELRNIHTHNRGIVNDLFISRVSTSPHKNFKFVLGKPYRLDFDEFIILSRNAIEVALNIDAKLCTKFKIIRARYKNRLEKDRVKKGVKSPIPKAPAPEPSSPTSQQS